MKKAMKNRTAAILILLVMLFSVFALAACGSKDGGNHADEPTNPTIKEGGLIAPDDEIALPTGDGNAETTITERKENDQEPDASEPGTTTGATSADGKPSGSSTPSTPAGNTGTSSSDGKPAESSAANAPIGSSGSQGEEEPTEPTENNGGIELPPVYFD